MADAHIGVARGACHCMYVPEAGAKGAERERERERERSTHGISRALLGYISLPDLSLLNSVPAWGRAVNIADFASSKSWPLL